MADFKNDLPVEARRQAEKMMVEIQKAGAMIMAVKAGARANGFVLGIQCSGIITEDVAQLLQSQFDVAAERQLRQLTLGAMP